jgi:hypothetical protein
MKGPGIYGIPTLGFRSRIIFLDCQAELQRGRSYDPPILESTDLAVDFWRLVTNERKNARRWASESMIDDRS